MSMTDIQGDLSDAERALLQGALALAHQGIPVFPVRPNGKVPLIHTDRHDWGATTDADQVAAYWTGRYRGCNVAIPTGERSGIWVLDIDVKQGAPGHMSLMTLIGRHGPLPKTLTIETWSGGTHYLFRHEQGIGNSAGRVGAGIDTRGDGGLIVTAPSSIDGKLYRVSSRDEFDEPLDFTLDNVAKAPDWLIELAREPKREVVDQWGEVTETGTPSPREPRQDTTHDKPSRAYIDASVDREFQAVATTPEGYRNDQLNKSSFALGQMVASNWIGADEAMSIMLRAARAAGLPKSEALQTIRSGLTSGAKHPRPTPARLPSKPGLPGERFEHPENPDKGDEWEEDTGPRKPRFTFETIYDLLKLPPATWLVKGWIPGGGVGIIHGNRSTGKSFLAFDLALHLANAMPDWHGVPLPEKGADTLVIAREGAPGFVKRVSAFNAHHGTGHTDRVAYMRAAISFDSDQQFHDLIEDIRDAGKRFDLTIIDTVGRVLPGVDMNEQKTITRFMERCQSLADATGGAVIAVHHQNKTGSIMGSVYFEANADFVFEVEKPDDAKKGPLKLVTLRCTKQKDAEDGWEKSASFMLVGEGDNASLVVRSITDETSGKGPDRRTCVMMLDEIRKAWDAKLPMSRHEQANRGKKNDSGRYAPRILSRDFGVSASEVKTLIQGWIDNAILTEDVVSSHTKMVGLKVIGRLD